MAPAMGPASDVGGAEELPFWTIAELDFLVGDWRGEGMLNDERFDAVLVSRKMLEGEFLTYELTTHRGPTVLHQERAMLSFDRKRSRLMGRFFSSGGLVEVAAGTMLWGQGGWPEFRFDVIQTENLKEGVRSRLSFRKAFDWEFYLTRELALPEDPLLRPYHEIHLSRERRSDDRAPVDNHAPRPRAPPSVTGG